MTAPPFVETNRALPYLSHARLQKYLHCPEQYRLYYLERLHPRVPSASLVFGQIVHHALADLFRSGVDPVISFDAAWTDVKRMDLRYSQRESWETLDTTGRKLLARFMREELPRLGHIAAPEQAFELALTSLDVPFVGVIDVCAELDGTPTVIDFKTSGSTYDSHEAALSDQLTAYQLAKPEVPQLALCVLVKTKEPRIEWHAVSRSGAQLVEFLSKAELVARAITAGHFYRRPGTWCAWCDYLPVCIGDQTKISETLVQIQ